MSLKIAGASGVVRWSYHSAATVGAWSIEDGVLSAAVTHVDPYRVSQRPLTFVVPRHGWRWALETLQITGTSLTARLGPKESITP